MKNALLPLIGLILFLFAQSCQNAASNGYQKSKVDSSGYKFVKSSVESGLTDVKASGLAITNSNNLRVIGLAKTLIASQTLTDSALLKLETEKNIAGGDTITAAHVSMLSDLSKKSGAAFDKVYIAMMIDDRQSAYDLCTIAANNNDADIKAFASHTISVIKTHLDSARAVLAALK